MVIDKQDMKSILEGFPEQIEEAIGITKDISVDKSINKIFITGMGGSALPGRILDSYIGHEIDIPIFVNTNYTMPKFVDSKSLVFAISFSGNTEETISACRDALKKKANVIGITKGGKLAELAKIAGFQFVKIPAPENMEPRSGWGYLFFSILNILENSGIIPKQDIFIKKTINTVKKDIFESKAEELAGMIEGKVPVIYSSDSMKGVAYKWKINFNENTKTNAFYNYFPELNHNEMNGYYHIIGDYCVIFLKDDEDHPKIQKRMAITKDIIRKKGAAVMEVGIAGECRLSKIISVIYLGDWVSYFLALKYGINPTPVDLIEEFKKKLKG